MELQAPQRVTELFLEAPVIPSLKHKRATPSVPPPQFISEMQVRQIVEKSFPLVTLSEADREEKRIKKKKYVTYSQCLIAHPVKTSLIVMSIAPWEIVKRTAKYTAIGAVCGGVVDAAMKNPTLTGLFAGMKIGGVAGIVAGVLYSKKKIDIKIEICDEFKKYRQSLTLEKYNLFLDLIKRYAKDFELSQEAHMFVDPITEELIQVPVRCPHGTVYDRTTIENYIKNQEAAEARARQSFPDYSDDQIGRIVRMTDPYGRRKFGVEELVFDAEFCKRAACFYKYILKELSISPDQDIEMIQGVQSVLSDLTKNNKAIRKQAVDTIRQAMYYKGASIEQVNELIKELKRRNIVIM